jgi:ABC-type antimicrobial peptide transport system permease subunit
VLRGVLGEGMAHATVGLGLGVLGSLALTRYVRTQLVGLEPTDPGTFVAATLVLMAVAVLACVVPARRAAGVDPLVALREE